MEDSSRFTVSCWTVILSGRRELEEAVVIYALYNQHCRFRFKSSCSIAFSEDTQFGSIGKNNSNHKMKPLVKLT